MSFVEHIIVRNLCLYPENRVITGDYCTSTKWYFDEVIFRRSKWYFRRSGISTKWYFDEVVFSTKWYFDEVVFSTKWYFRQSGISTMWYFDEVVFSTKWHFRRSGISTKWCFDEVVGHRLKLCVLQDSAYFNRYKIFPCV